MKNINNYLIKILKCYLLKCRACLAKTNSNKSHSEKTDRKTRGAPKHWTKRFLIINITSLLSFNKTRNGIKQIFPHLISAPHISYLIPINFIFLGNNLYYLASCFFHERRRHLLIKYWHNQAKLLETNYWFCMKKLTKHQQSLQSLFMQRK